MSDSHFAEGDNEEAHPTASGLAHRSTAESAESDALRFPATPESDEQNQVVVALNSTNGFAISALVFAIVGFFAWGLGALLAILLALVARRQIRRSPRTESGRGLATAALVIAVIQLTTILLSVAAVIGYAAWQDHQDRAEIERIEATCAAERMTLEEALDDWDARYYDPDPMQAKPVDSLEDLDLKGVVTNYDIRYNAFYMDPSPATFRPDIVVVEGSDCDN